MKTAYLSDKGRVRTLNEDGVGVFPIENNGVFAVIADGMGGHNAGDVASSMAIQYLSETIETLQDLFTPREAEEWLRKQLEEVNKHIYIKSKEDQSCEGMGTTIVAALCYDSFISIAHVGDSRCYKCTEEGVFLLTEDHTLVNELVKTGQITKEDANHHPRKNILTRAIGTNEKVSIDVQTREWELGELLLLCSDGLSNKVAVEDYYTLMRENIDLDSIAKELVSMANKNGGEDNITLALVYNDSAKEFESL